MRADVVPYRYLDFYYPELNFVSRERLDPIISYLFGEALNQPRYLVGQIFILFLGLCYWQWVLRAPRPLLRGAVISAAVVFLTGADPFLLKIHWLPFFIAALQDAYRSGSARGKVLSVIGVTMWSLTAGAFGVLGSLLAVLLVRERGQHLFADVVALMAIFLPFLWLQGYPMPEYPPQARLTDVSPLSFLPLPLIGPSLFPNSVLYDGFLREFSAQLGRFAIVIVAAALSVGVGFSVRRVGEAIPGLVVLLLTLLLGGSPLIVELGSSPFVALVQIVPGLALSPFPWMLFALGGLIGLGLILARTDGLQFALTSVIVVFALAVYLTLPRTEIPLLKTRSGGIDHFEERSYRWPDLVARSPSGWIVRTSGAWTAERAAAKGRASLTKLVTGRDYNWSVAASVNESTAARAIDGDPKTRWGTGRPQQSDDSFTISFDRVVEVLRLELEIDENATDFPRSLRIEAAEDGERYRIVREEGAWLGPIRWNDSGYPYFGPQGEVVIDFAEPIRAARIRLVQTASDPRFDWSINEISVFR